MKTHLVLSRLRRSNGVVAHLVSVPEGETLAQQDLTAGRPIVVVDVVTITRGAQTKHLDFDAEQPADRSKDDDG